MRRLFDPLTKEERMRGRTVGRLALLFVASVVAVAALGVSAWSQAPLDPQSLIGDWNGPWTNKKAQGVDGQYHLMIEQVNGKKVYGQVEFSGPQTAQFKLLGTLDGNRLLSIAALSLPSTTTRLTTWSSSE